MRVTLEFAFMGNRHKVPVNGEVRIITSEMSESRLKYLGTIQK